MQQSLAHQPNDILFVQHKKSLRLVQIFGILHIINSVLILSFGATIIGGINIRREVNDQASAIWSSPFFMTTGILGVIIFCKPASRALITTHNVFAITSTFLSVAVLVTSSLGIDFYNCERKYINTRYFYERLYYPYECRWSFVRHTSQPLYGMLIVFSVLELTFSIVSTVYSFKLFNCCPCTASGGCECVGCDECQNRVSGSVAYQMQPVNPMAYPPNVMQPNCLMQPNYLMQQPPQHLQPAYIQNVPNQALTASAPIQCNVQQIQNAAQVVTNAAGQQFFLVPITQPQPAESPSIATTSTSTATSTPTPVQQLPTQPPSYTKDMSE